MVGVPRAATTSDPFNAIAEPCRRQILDALAGGEASVGDLCTRLRLPQPQVSKHLGVLRTVDLVRCRADGKRRLYRVHGPALRDVHRWLSTFEHTWQQRLDRFEDIVTELRQETQR